MRNKPSFCTQVADCSGVLWKYPPLAVVKWIHNRRHAVEIPHSSLFITTELRATRFVAGQEIFLFSEASNRYGTHRLPHLKDSDGCFPEGKAAGTWSWPLTSNIEIKNEWRYLSTSWYLHGVVLKHRHNFTYRGTESSIRWESLQEMPT